MESLTGQAKLDAVLHKVRSAKSRDQDEEARIELAQLVPDYLDEIITLYEAHRFDRHVLVWSLIGQTSNEAFDVFADAVTDKNQYVRWAAVIALRKIRRNEARKHLVNALKDRSHLVKFEAVQAMQGGKDPGAIPQLQKIVDSKYLQRTSPGMVAVAKKALTACRKNLAG